MATRGQRRHLVSLFSPGPSVPDDDGGFTQPTPVALTPSTMFAEIRPASAQDLERVVSQTVQSKASHLVTIDYHPQLTTATVLHFGARVFSVTGYQNIDERNVEMVLSCEEVIA